MSRFRFWKNFN